MVLVQCIAILVHVIVVIFQLVIIIVPAMPTLVAVPFLRVSTSLAWSAHSLASAAVVGLW
jgi:hypothetical protein